MNLIGLLKMISRKEYEQLVKKYLTTQTIDKKLKNFPEVEDLKYHILAELSVYQNQIARASGSYLGFLTWGLFNPAPPLIEYPFGGNDDYLLMCLMKIYELDWDYYTRSAHKIEDVNILIAEIQAGRRLTKEEKAKYRPLEEQKENEFKSDTTSEEDVYNDACQMLFNLKTIRNELKAKGYDDLSGFETVVKKTSFFDSLWSKSEDKRLRWPYGQDEQKLMVLIRNLGMPSSVKESQIMHFYKQLKKKKEAHPLEPPVDPVITRKTQAPEGTLPTSESKVPNYGTRLA